MKGKKWLSILTICFVMILSCGLLSACGGSNIKLQINFDSNGGTECSSIEYVVGKSFNMPSDPTRDGFVFDGWYEDEDTWEKPFTTNTVLNYPLSKNMAITVYAKWLPSLNITFDSNGGSECESAVFTGFDTLPTPTRNKHTFMGWYIDFGVWKKPFNTNTITQFETNAAVTLYARWSLDRYIVFEVNEGKEIEPLLILATDNINLPTAIKPFNIFRGWYMDSNLTIPFDKSLVNFDEYQTELKVYAKWEEKVVENVEIYGSPKTEYVYGEKLDLQNMYAEVDYYYYGSERVYITEDMVSNFNTTDIVANRLVNERNQKMTIKVKDVEKEFDYCVKPKYKEIRIKEGSIKTEFLLGEDSTYKTYVCSGSKENPRGSYFGIKCTIIATNNDNTTEEIDVIARTKKKSKIDIRCDVIGHIHFSIDYIDIIVGNNIIVDRQVYFHDKKEIITANAYTDLTTDDAGTFTGTIYYGLLSTQFEYSVKEAESQVESYSQEDYKIIEEIATDKNSLYFGSAPSYAITSIRDRVIQITLKNGRKFDWTIPKNRITTDIQLNKSGDFECLVNLPTIDTTATLIKIKYSVISLEDIDYILIANYMQCVETGTNKLKYIPSNQSKIYYTVNNEQKTILGVAFWSSDFDICPELDLTNGEHEIIASIKGVEVKLKYDTNSNIVGFDNSLKEWDIHVDIGVND